MSAEGGPIREGQILTGPLFSEPMQVETVRPNGPDVWVAGLVGQRSEQFRRVTLTSDDISNLTIADSALSYDGAGRLLRIGLQAYSLGIAYDLPSVRFLLAADAGAGKTIMAGLLVRELKEKFLSPDINFSPKPVMNDDGSVKQPGLDNHGMGTVFEELVRRFNEENNEEAGEHWTPRDTVKLMGKLIFLPVAGEIEAADNVVGGAEHSTLSNDAFPGREFDFMLSNPPYGKSWKSDLERMGGKAGIKDPRFLIAHDGDAEYPLITRSSDGQMLFLANMLSKMKQGTKLGSRIAEVHNGSSLFTGDAGQGKSNIRRWIIENDWLEAIVALPLNMFYNTGIATYIWVLTNRKPVHRRGKVQLIDATQRFQPLRKNLGKKNCALSDEDI